MLPTASYYQAVNFDSDNGLSFVLDEAIVLINAYLWSMEKIEHKKKYKSNFHPS